MAEKTLRAFVIGWPIAHSLSPYLHQYWLKHHNINGSYEKIAIAPEELTEFLNDMSKNNFVGGNVTIPHKEKVFAYLSNSDGLSTRLEATNTLLFDDNVLSGTNTDGYGFTANLDQYSKSWRNANTATVLGAGGAAKAIVLALLNAGILNISIINRTKRRAEDLAKFMGAKCSAHTFEDVYDLLPATDLLINTTSLGMKDQPPLELDISALPKTAIVTDIVYNPIETGLLRQAKLQNLDVVDGIGMLLHQAVPGFEKWFAVRPQVTPQLRDHMLKILEAS